MENEDAEDSQSDEGSDLGGQYGYLLGMTLWTLTKERKDELLQKRDEKLAELKILQGRSPSSLWKEDLDAFLEEVSFDKTQLFLKENLSYSYSLYLFIVPFDLFQYLEHKFDLCTFCHWFRILNPRF
jgi:hypothetical protein